MIIFIIKINIIKIMTSINETEVDSLISSFNNLVCDLKSDLPAVLYYRKNNKFSTYYNLTSDNCHYCNEIVTYFNTRK
jgi:hypothetical protein